MKLFGNNILVEELRDNLVLDGVLIKYDDSNQYMFAKIINLPEKLISELDLNVADIIIINRVTKLPFIDGNYFINSNNIIASLTKEEYNKLVSKGVDNNE